MSEPGHSLESETTREVMDILPTFMIPGAAKAGTGYLAHVLSQHPDVFLPYVREPAYFSTHPEEGRHHKGYGYYRRLLAPGRRAKHLCDASTNYLWDSQAPKLISGCVPNVKFVIILRNPIERTYSGYWQDIKTGRELGDFKTGLMERQGRVQQMVERSRYDVQLKRYFQFFDRKQMLILFYDDLRKDPQQVIDRILTFLDLAALPQNVDLNARINAPGSPRSVALARFLRNDKVVACFRAVAPAALAPKLKQVIDFARTLNERQGRYPEMDNETRQGLIEIFRAPVAELSEMLEADLTHWLK